MSAPAPTIDTANFVSKADYDALKQEVGIYKTAAEEAKSTYQKQIDAIVEERRKEKITAIVEAKISDKGKSAETIKKFVDAKVTPEIVADAMALIPEPQRKDNTELFNGKVQDASANPHAGSFAAYQRYVNSQIKGSSL